MQLVPRFSYGRGLLRKNGAPNRMFLMFLFGHQELPIQFLKDLVLIPSKVQCNVCQRDTTCTADPDHSDGYRWRCRKRFARFRYSGTASIRHGNTTFPQISAYRREQRLIACAVNFLRLHRHVILFTSSAFPQTGIVPHNTDHVQIRGLS